MGSDSTPGTLRVVLTCGIFAAFGWLLALPDPGYANEIRDRQWHLDFLDIRQAHRITRGEGVTVAVVDSGVDHRHPDLQNALLPGRNYSAGRRDGWSDATGHGTGMAALIAARGHGRAEKFGVMGIAPAAKILPVRVTGNGAFSSPRALEQGIEWATDHDADILSISLTDVENPAVAAAVRYAQAKGVLVIAGAGNTGNGDREVMWPARYPGVIAVSGIDREGGFTNASVSGPEVVLSAPATDIATAGRESRYSAGTGTSNSAAIVAGVAALVKARFPELNTANLVNRLIITADDRGSPGRDPRYGFGIVDPVAALTDDVPSVAGNPLLAPTTSAAGLGTGTVPASTTPDNGGSAGAVVILLLGCLIGAVVGLASLVRRRRPRMDRHVVARTAGGSADQAAHPTVRHVPVPTADERP